MKSVIYFVLVILTISSSLNCVKDTNPVISNNNSDSFYPLQIGNLWNYNEQFTNNEKVADTATFGGSKYYNIKSSHIIQPDFWIREKANTIYFLDPEINDEYILFDFNANSGDSWAMPDGFGCTFGDRIILLSDSETVRTPAGTFYNCFHFQHETRCMDGGLRDTWFAKGIGIVKSIQDSWAGYHETLLVSYSFVDKENN